MFKNGKPGIRKLPLMTNVWFLAGLGTLVVLVMIYVDYENGGGIDPITAGVVGGWIGGIIGWVGATIAIYAKQVDPEPEEESE